MRRRVAEEDDSDGPWDDESDEFELDAEDDATIPCPWCRQPIPEDTPRCPYCERYLSKEDAPPERKPWWIVIGAVVALYFVYRWIVG
jgi:hypothetical protein